MAREVLVDNEGLATGVSYIDTRRRKEVQVRAKVVILAASACETARLLLNSRSRLHPNGLANSAGLVGRYLMDTVGTDLTVGFLPILADLDPHNEDGVGGMHLYMPWWNYQQQLRNQLPFARGYHIEFGGGRELPGCGIFNDMNHKEEGYGVDLKRRARKNYGTTIGFAGRGEMIPNPDTYCEIDPDVYGSVLELLEDHWSSGDAAPASARKALRECVEKLSPYARQLIQMRYVDDLSGQEVAERLNRSPNTVYVALSRTYRHLAGCVERRLAREGA